MKLFTFVSLLLLVHCRVLGQSSPASPASEKSPVTKEQPNGVYSGRDVFVPAVTEKKEPDSTATSFSDGFLRNTRRHLGLSFSAFESYTSNMRGSSTGQTGVTVATLLPQIYANVQKKRFDFRSNYGAVVTRYNKDLSE